MNATILFTPASLHAISELGRLIFIRPRGCSLFEASERLRTLGYTYIFPSPRAGKTIIENYFKTRYSHTLAR